MKIVHNWKLLSGPGLESVGGAVDIVPWLQHASVPQFAPNGILSLSIRQHTRGQEELCLKQVSCSLSVTRLDLADAMHRRAHTGYRGIRWRVRSLRTTYTDLGEIYGALKSLTV
jgi:hypothetical protein